MIWRGDELTAVVFALQSVEHGALLELSNGELRHYMPAAVGTGGPSARLSLLPRSASFPVPCERVTFAPTPPNANQVCS